MGHVEIWITDPAAGPYISPLIWLDGPQLLAGDLAQLLRLTGGKSGQGHCLVHLLRYEPAASLWVEQIGDRLGGITGTPANHYPTLSELQSERRYGSRRIFTVFLRGLTADELARLDAFLRDLGDDYAGYTYGYPNCADLGADAVQRAFGPSVPQGAFWFPLDLAAHTLNLPRHLHPRLAPLGRLSPIPWRNRTPDQLRRRLRRLRIPHLDRRAIGDLTPDEARRARSAPGERG